MNFLPFQQINHTSMHHQSQVPMLNYSDLLVFAEGNVAPVLFKFELDFLGGELFVDIGNEVNFVLKGSFISLIQVTKKLIIAHFEGKKIETGRKAYTLM